MSLPVALSSVPCRDHWRVTPRGYCSFLITEVFRSLYGPGCKISDKEHLKDSGNFDFAISIIVLAFSEVSQRIIPVK